MNYQEITMLKCLMCHSCLISDFRSQRQKAASLWEDVLPCYLCVWKWLTARVQIIHNTDIIVQAWQGFVTFNKLETWNLVNDLSVFKKRRTEKLCLENTGRPSQKCCKELSQTRKTGDQLDKKTTLSHINLHSALINQTKHAQDLVRTAQ